MGHWRSSIRRSAVSSSVWPSSVAWSPAPSWRCCWAGRSGERRTSRRSRCSSRSSVGSCRWSSAGVVRVGSSMASGPPPSSVPDHGSHSRRRSRHIRHRSTRRSGRRLSHCLSSPPARSACSRRATAAASWSRSPPGASPAPPYRRRGAIRSSRGRSRRAACSHWGSPWQPWSRRFVVGVWLPRRATQPEDQARTAWPDPETRPPF